MGSSPPTCQFQSEVAFICCSCVTHLVTNSWEPLLGHCALLLMVQSLHACHHLESASQLETGCHLLHRSGEDTEAQGDKLCLLKAT
jgi:hypothetical protein